jgi:hypothetical protein
MIPAMHQYISMDDVHPDPGPLNSTEGHLPTLCLGRQLVGETGWKFGPLRKDKSDRSIRHRFGR